MMCNTFLDWVPTTVGCDLFRIQAAASSCINRLRKSHGKTRREEETRQVCHTLSTMCVCLRVGAYTHATVHLCMTVCRQRVNVRRPSSISVTGVIAQECKARGNIKPVLSQNAFAMGMYASSSCHGDGEVIRVTRPCSTFSLLTPF